MSHEIHKEHLALCRKKAKEALPKGWKARVHKYAGGVRAYVYQAPVDLLKDFRDHGLPLDQAMHFESNNLYPFVNYMTPANGMGMSTLYDAMLDVVEHFGLPVSVYLGVGCKTEPFSCVIKPPKKLHPAVQAYADHAKAMGAKWKAEDAKRLVPNYAKKLLKNAHHSWT